jgi:5-methylthioadenosine/S-adenosylhomocysteine deaminase
MEKIDHLLINAIVLTMDEDFNQFEPGAVAVLGDSIIAVGPMEEITACYISEQTIDCKGNILIPGLINAHTHVPMTLLRGLADDLRLDVWLMGYIMPVEREFVSPEFVQLGTKLACAEMIRSGVTTFADMYYFEEDIAEATADAGMRALCSQTVLKFPSPDAQSFEDSLSASRDFIKRWIDHPLIVPSVAPHAAYTCTEEILKATADLAIEFDVPLHIHIAETSFEVENMRRDLGMPVVPYVKKQGILDAKTLAAHCVHVDEGEIRTLLNHGAGVAHNPSSNMKLASGMAPIQRMIDLGLNVGIGTDGTASNNDLDMFEEMRLAAFLAKVSTNDPTALPARTAMLMATRLGANALHIGDITGSLEVGKRADIALVDIHTLHNSPRFRRDPLGAYAQLVYAGKATDVTDVMINGNWVMQNQQLLTLDEDGLIEQCRDIAHKMDIFLLDREQSVRSKLIAIGGATEEESFEIQIKIAIKDPQPILNSLNRPEIAIIYQRHYREFDTYFEFKDKEEGYLRFREDHFIEENNEVKHVRFRLTLIGPESEQQYPEKALLSRSRFLAPATQSLRFYREYFKPLTEAEIEKDRLRYLISFKNAEFYINIDTVTKPDLGCFLEIKSRTWSRQDADQKSLMIKELVELFDVVDNEVASSDYIKVINAK